MQKNTYTAIITARGGSKGLPRKNVLDLAGKPMIAHTITAALESQCFEHIVVTTDCPEIKEVSLAWGAEVIDRPKELATDSSSSLDVVKHTLLELVNQNKETTHFILLQPTSPLRSATHIKDAKERFNASNAKSLVSVTKTEHPIQKNLYFRNGVIEPVFDWASLTAPRQSLESTYLINGAIYISNFMNFIKRLNLFEKPVIPFEMEHKFSIDIDNIDDLINAESIYKN
ncbi:cytidylyltransferase domain-containing protein [Endozoicomonas sp. SESOKO2]|uniref:acylneuraminate cytidylyltransferase family protein n=1 Tax=Endozoicomonas sp. SESOKO2 TaxID=2828743 RepID=UPI0021485FA6|nr:acylneuraminate cytidylyltransferase family protein [Endozoicomonas sp. SESOKO2]